MKQHRRFLALLSPLCLLAASGWVQAQQVYRTVGPDGKVTFSDRAPLKDAPAAKAQRAAAAPEGAQSAALPYELRLVATRFPVTLYTGSDCTPCVSARNLLINRGVPFTERTVSSNEDIEAFQRLNGNTGLPFGTIGGQQLNGFSSSEWTQYLDAAGYPKQSQLPPGYQRAPATPLVALKRPEPAAGSRPQSSDLPAAPRTAAPPAQNPAPSNPAGIRF